MSEEEKIALAKEMLDIMRKRGVVEEGDIASILVMIHYSLVMSIYIEQFKKTKNKRKSKNHVMIFIDVFKKLIEEEIDNTTEDIDEEIDNTTNNK